MPYSRVDDQEWMDPRVQLAGLAAYGVLNRLRGYTAAYMTDGLIPGTIAIACAEGDLGHLERLEDSAWIKRHETGMVEILGHLEHNMSREEWEAEKGKRSSNASKAAKARWANR